MRIIGWGAFFTVSMGLLLGAGQAAADSAVEKIFILKNGRHIRAELVSETRSEFNIKTEGGKIALPRDMVLRVEDPPPPPKKFLEPDPVKPQAPASDDDAPSSSPEAKKPAPQASAPPTPSAGVQPGAALATPDEIVAARKLLASVPPVSNDADATAQREKALTSVRIAVSVQVLVAVATDNSGLVGPTGERQLALEAILPKRDAARPYLAQSIANFEPVKGSQDELVAAIEKVGDDQQGIVEQTLLARIDGILKANLSPTAKVRTSPDVFINALGKVGTRRSLEPLVNAMFAPKLFGTLQIYGKTCQAIVARDQAPDEALAPIYKLIDPQTLPELARLPYVIPLFEASRGPAIAVIDRLVDALDRIYAKPDDKATESAVSTSLERAYGALAAIGTLEAAQDLLQHMDFATQAPHRILCLQALGHFRKSDAEPGPRLQVLNTLVNRMNEPNRDEAEVTALGAALHDLTGEGFGFTPGRWREYVQGLQRANDPR